MILNLADCEMNHLGDAACDICGRPHSSIGHLVIPAGIGVVPVGERLTLQGHPNNPWMVVGHVSPRELLVIRYRGYVDRDQSQWAGALTREGWNDIANGRDA